jgi:hypothetical protein
MLRNSEDHCLRHSEQLNPPMVVILSQCELLKPSDGAQFNPPPLPIVAVRERMQSARLVKSTAVDVESDVLEGRYTRSSGLYEYSIQFAYSLFFVENAGHGNLHVEETSSVNSCRSIVEDDRFEL